MTLKPRPEKHTLSGKILTISQAVRIIWWYGAWINRLRVHDPECKLLKSKERSIERLIKAMKFLGFLLPASVQGAGVASRQE
jgi:hypothetical protein